MAKVVKKEERGFVYRKRSKESLKERANMKGGNFDSYIKPKFKQWKPKDGKNLIRILPASWDKEDAPWQTVDHYGLDIYVNFNIGADNQSYLSLSKHQMGEDPLAEARREAQNEGEKELAKKLQPNQRILYWIIDRNDEDEGPLLWAAPFTFDKALANICIDEDTKEVLYIDDPVHGNDVRFYKEGTGLLTKYDPSKMKVLAESSIHEDEGIEDEWLEFIQENPLPTVLNFYEYDHIKATFDGQIGSRDDEEDDEKPVRGKRVVKDEDDPEAKPARRRTRVEEPEDEPEEKPRSRRQPVEEDEPEEKPARTSRRARVVVEEDEPEPEADEDDEAPPTRSRRGRTEPEEDEKPAGGRSGTLREKLAAARRQRG